ncbi:phage tail terminator family protein [Desulfosporosinus fructosivorans]
MITINMVRDSVMTTLKQHFPNLNVYGEEHDQGLEEPYFYVKLLPVTQNQLLGQRYQRNHSFDIHYLAGANEALHDMAEQLYDKLELISLDGSPVRGTGMRHEIVDGVLHWFVAYNFQVMRSVEAEPLMQSMKQEGYLRG